MTELNKIALKILSNGKGILAADESNGTMSKRLESVNIQSTPENRLLFRETLFSVFFMRNSIGSVILYDDTINQKSNYGKTIPPTIIILSNLGIKFLIILILVETFEPPIMQVIGFLISEVIFFKALTSKSSCKPE